jgi:CRP-like cAMP-binding protein
MDIKQLLQKLDIFSNLDKNEIETITNITTIKNFENKQIVFYEGEIPEYFYILLEGDVKIYKVDNKGNEIILHHFSGTTMVAEMASIENFWF